METNATGKGCLCTFALLSRFDPIIWAIMAKFNVADWTPLGSGSALKVICMFSIYPLLLWLNATYMYSEQVPLWGSPVLWFFWHLNSGLGIGVVSSSHTRNRTSSCRACISVSESSGGIVH